MCRNIKTLFNFEPPATEDEIRAASLQFVRKLSGFNTPSKANKAAFDQAVEEVSAVASVLLGVADHAGGSAESGTWRRRGRRSGRRAIRHQISARAHAHGRCGCSGGAFQVCVAGAGGAGHATPDRGSMVSSSAADRRPLARTRRVDCRCGPAGVGADVADAGARRRRSAFWAPSLSPRLQRYARLAADFLIIAVLGVLSAIPVQPELVIAASFAFATASFVLDRIRAWLISSRLSPLLLAAPIVVVLALGVQVRQPGDFGSRLLDEDLLFPFRLALVIPSAGERLPLEDGTGAWLLETPLDESRGTAIVLHGNHRLGSRQPSGLVLQGALLSAGYDVLSVDHPGFGASAAPPAGADWHAWDPTHGVVEALRYLDDRNGPSHWKRSWWGTRWAWMWRSNSPRMAHPVGAVYLWGGALDRPYGPNWVSGFHRERNIPCCLPPASLNRIRDEFYGGGDRFAAALPEPHAPVHFVRFGIEHADVTRDREPLYAAISEPKRLCDFNSVSHYFNTLAIRGFVLIDTLTVRRTTEIFVITSAARTSSAARRPR